MTTPISATTRAVLAALVLAGLLAACAPPRPMTFEEQQAWMAKQQCIQEANDMNDPPWNSGNPFWASYFVMCMNRFGIPDSVLDRMWY